MAIETKLYGLIGYPVKHSLSSSMHNAAFKALNINAEYRLFEIRPEELEEFLLSNIQVKDTEGDSFYSQDITGFNITIPHKVKAKEILEKEFPPTKVEELFHTVEIAGAINTVDRKKKECLNTDVLGFSQSLREDLKFDTKDKNVLLIGCGGAGRAVIACLVLKRTLTRKIYIYDISDAAINSAKKHFSDLHTKFSFLKEKLEFILEEQIPDIIKKCQLLVNASPIGMKETDDSIINKDLLHEGLSVYDVVYNRETQLIKDANSIGLSAKNGLGMLLYQGVLSFNYWTGMKAPEEIMWKALTSQVTTQ